MFHISKFADDHFHHYYNPGIYLKDDDLFNLHQTIQNINQASKKPIEHKLVSDIPDIELLREHYKSTIVCIIKVANIDSGFLISPILKVQDDMPLLHGGLFMINYNKGSSLMALAGSGTVLLAYQKLGQHYCTNISSTPAIIEAYTPLTSNCWPTPKSNLIRPPREYIRVAETLVESYVKKYFPDPSSIYFDPKRFIIRSESKKMGFNTNFRQISRSSSFDYLNFCFTWIDYEKEEDLIQVGIIDAKSIRRVRLWRNWYLWQIIKKQSMNRLKSIFMLKDNTTVPKKKALK